MRKYNVLAASVSFVGALAAILVFFLTLSSASGLDGLQVWAASRSIPIRPSQEAVSAQAPAIPVLLIPDDDTATRDSIVTFGWSDVAAASYTLQVGGAEYTTPDTSKTLDLADGVYTWTVRAVDAFGVPSGYADPWTVTVDTTPPAKPTLIGPEDGAASPSEEVLFSWGSVHDAAFYNLRVDGEVHTTTATSAVRTLAEGAHEWAVQAQDELYNASGYTAPRTVTVDTVRPAVTLSVPLDGAVLTTTHLYTVTIAGMASDVGTGLDRVEVNTGTGWNLASGTGNWTYDWTLPFVDNGSREVRARAFDRAGNESNLSQVTVTVDTIAPTCGPPRPDRSGWVTATVTYDWDRPPDGSGIGRYQIRIYSDSGYDATFDVLDTRYVFTQATVERAVYRARVRAMDGRGNWGPWSAPSDLVIPDLTPPTIWDAYIVEDSIYLYAVGTTLYYTNTMVLPHSFEVRGHSDDALSGVQQVCFTPAFGGQPSCDIDGFQPWQSIDPRYAVTPGATASGQIVATVYDKAGNTVRQTFVYEPDATPPESSASASPLATGSPIRVAWTADDAQSGVHSVDLWYRYEIAGTWTYAQTRLAGHGSFEFEPLDGQGTYYFATVARDNLGNREPGVTVADTQTLYDTTAPTSEVTWAPLYWNHLSAPIAMTWVATPSLPGNPITEVRLWVRFNAGDWISTTITGTGTSGVFEYDPLQGDGVYDFATVARDASGKSEALPFNSGDRTTEYDTAIDAPVGLACEPATWTRTNSFTVRWTNPGDLSGIAAARYKIGTAPAGPLDGTRVPGDGLQQIAGIALPGEGQHTVWVWLEDMAGNIDHARRQSTVCWYDASIGAPSGLMVSPSVWTATDAFTATWSNPSDLSGIAGAYWKLGSPPASAEDWTEWVPGSDLDRISDISVGKEGAHTLYLWLYDTAGNVGVSRWQTASLLYDPTPPTDVLISTPEDMTKARFEVYWTANAAASGLLHYTVEYSGATASTWQPWLDATTEISALFTAPLAGTEYAFRVTAHDCAGNSAQAQMVAYLELQRVYLPFCTDRWADWHRLDTYEFNDTPRDAHGPLKIGEIYRSSIWNEHDLDDWYHFTIVSDTAKIRIQVLLEGVPENKDYDLYIYEGESLVLVGRSAGRDQRVEQVTFEAKPGIKYYIRGHPYRGPDSPPNNYSQEQYSLTILSR